MSTSFRNEIISGIPVNLPEMPPDEPGIPHAPARRQVLTVPERAQAVRNALRYFDPRHHAVLAPEFAKELATEGRIYMRRFRPTYTMYARPISEYPANSQQAAAIMLMIQNNLDPAVAQFPHELITYGGNGSVFQNWAQYRLAMKYLSQMTNEQTLVMSSGHPLGLFPSHPDAPRVVVSNGIVIPSHSSKDEYERLAALGVTMYGQMTAGSYMYIGPQGIVHGTTLTLLNAGRLALGLEPDENLAGKLFVSSGLGGMSGAQAKAVVINGGVGIIAEFNPKAVQKRLDQGWLMEAESNLDRLFARVQSALSKKQPLSIAYVGNVVNLWEALANSGTHVDLGSDQTSLHNPFGGGYYPQGLTIEGANKVMRTNPEAFKTWVERSLRSQAAAIQRLVGQGMYFFDYGNAFLKEAAAAGAGGLTRPDGSFTLPSYVEDIMGPQFFDYGFGPFRWVCTSGLPEELAVTDSIAREILINLANPNTATWHTRQQLLDNVKWISQAAQNNLVVGSQARILYADMEGRLKLAHAFNQAVRKGLISRPIVIGRDHHDVSGTDSPYRETANIHDGSMFTADMAVQTFVGNALRGATWVSLHNGGGVGWGEVMNGGFGLVLDGSPEAGKRADSMLKWDVANGLARRAWAQNPNARFAANEAMRTDGWVRINLPHSAEDRVVAAAINQAFGDD